MSSRPFSLATASDRLFGSGHVGDVEATDLCAPALGLDGIGNLAGRDFTIDVADHHVGAAFGEGFADGSADAARSAGYQRNFLFQIDHASSKNP